MEKEFVAHGSVCISNSGGYLVEISDCGDSARVKDSWGSEDPQVSDWFEIEYIENEDNPDEYDPIIDPEGYNINLNNVMRV